MSVLDRLSGQQRRSLVPVIVPRALFSLLIQAGIGRDFSGGRKPTRKVNGYVQGRQERQGHIVAVEEIHSTSSPRPTKSVIREFRVLPLVLKAPDHLAMFHVVSERREEMTENREPKVNFAT